MSRESLNWLNTNTLIGFTDKRGTAWHWRAEEQGEQSNHYPGPIPISDVQERLFHWTADSRRIAVEVPAEASTTTHSRDGLPMRWAVVEDRQAIGRSDDHTGNVMGIFGPGYQRHQYREWLLTTVADLLDDDLAISSAGLLRGGAIAWVEVSMPETITTPEGVAFRPNLLARTSFDGSISTTYKRTVTDTVCDNPRELALAEQGQELKVKHSRNSHAQLGPARQALAMVHTLADDFAHQVATLCQLEVSPRQWAGFLDAHIPRTDSTGQPLVGRARTMADNKRDTLMALYRSDPRVAPWSGTAHGVLQAVNTYEQHNGVIRGDRAERNSLKTITGEFGKLDRSTWHTRHCWRKLPDHLARLLSSGTGGRASGRFLSFQGRACGQAQDSCAPAPRELSRCQPSVTWAPATAATAAGQSAHKVRLTTSSAAGPSRLGTSV